jgi:hypothetical protein
MKGHRSVGHFCLSPHPQNTWPGTELKTKIESQNNWPSTDSFKKT